jgi:hypothetical protein
MAYSECLPNPWNPLWLRGPLSNRCENSLGVSEWSQNLRVTTNDSARLPDEFVISASPQPAGAEFTGAGAILVEWEPPPVVDGLAITKIEVSWIKADAYSEWEQTNSRNSRRSGSPRFNPWEISSLHPDFEQFTIEPLEGGAPYVVRIRGINRNGPGVYSTTTISAWRALPGPPQMQLADVAAETVTVQWDGNDEDESTEAIIYYQIRCIKEGEPADEDDGERMLQQAIDVTQIDVTQDTAELKGALGRHHIPAHARKWTVDGLAPSETYIIQMCSCTKRGSLGWSRPMCVTSAAPVELRLVAESISSLTTGINRGKSVGNTIELRCLNEMSRTEKVLQPKPEDEEVEIGELQPGCHYQLFVRESGAQEWGKPTLAQTHPGRPVAPSSLKHIHIGDTSFTVSWAAKYNGGANLKEFQFEFVEGKADVLNASLDIEPEPKPEPEPESENDEEPQPEPE